MGTLALGFLAAWTAVAAYVGWLGLQQHRLSKRLDAAQQRDTTAAGSVRSRAA